MMETRPLRDRDIDPILEHEMRALKERMNPELSTLFRLMLQTGVRTSEALALREKSLWEDGVGRGIYVERLKRRRPVRDKIQLADADLVGELRALGRRQRPRLFGYKRRGVATALHRYCMEAGVRHLSPHQFRHTFAREFATMTLYDRHGRVLSPLDHRILLAAALGHSSTRWVDIYFQPHGIELQAPTFQVGKALSTWS